MMEKTFAFGAVKDCCKASGNLVVVDAESSPARGLTVRRCRVCGCRHRHLVVERGIIGMTLKPKAQPIVKT